MTGEFDELSACNESHSIGNFLRTTNFHSLSLLERLHKACRFDKRIKRPCIEPGKSSPHLLHMKRILAKIPRVYIGDFQFTPPRGLDLRRIANDLIIEKIKPCDGPI